MVISMDKLTSDPRLSISFDSARLSHAYIATGDLANIIAMAVVCSASEKRPCMRCAHCNKSSRGIHPDITVVRKQEGKREILIEQIRELKRDVIIVPNESDKKAYVIDDADTMNDNAQNALLKILEEPPSHAVFILRSSSPAELLPTVRSRCVELKSNDIRESADAAASAIANEFFEALKSGNASLAEFMFRLEKLSKEQFALFIEAARERDAMEMRTALAAERNRETSSAKNDWMLFSRAERILMKSNEYLDLNVNQGHISGLICASLIDFGG